MRYVDTAHYAASAFHQAVHVVARPDAYISDFIHICKINDFS